VPTHSPRRLVIACALPSRIVATLEPVGAASKLHYSCNVQHCNLPVKAAATQFNVRDKRVEVMKLQRVIRKSTTSSAMTRKNDTACCSHALDGGGMNTRVLENISRLLLSAASRFFPVEADYNVAITGTYTWVQGKYAGAECMLFNALTIL
jgi:hypothetical protein